MNKNTKRKRDAALDAFHRKHKSEADIKLSGLIGHAPRRYRNPKVARSAAEITRTVGRDRA